MLQPIEAHYTRLIDAQHQQIIEKISHTYHNILANTWADLPNLIENSMVISITNLILNLKTQPIPVHTNIPTTNSATVSNSTFFYRILIPQPLTVMSSSNNNNTPADGKILTNHTNKQSVKARRKNNTTHIAEQCTSHNCFECAVNNIVNLSNVQLTKTQILLLNRGLSFVPTAYTYGIDQRIQQLCKQS